MSTTTNAKHTPGPWSVAGHGEPTNPLHIYSPYDRDHLGTGCIATIHGERPANARLIAAAPDLLAACEAALALSLARFPSTVSPEVSDLEAKLSAAIAKAVGE